MTKRLLLLICSICSLNCEKSNQPSKREQDISWAWEIMNNPTDPLFAIAKNDSLQMEFYGDRNLNGIPAILNTIIFRSIMDTVYFHFDKLGRPASVKTNKEIEYVFNLYSETSGEITFYTADGHSAFLEKVYFNTLPDPANSDNRLQSNNIGVDVFTCQVLDTSGTRIVGMEMKQPYNQNETHYFPVQFANGKYSSSIPRDFSFALSPSDAVSSAIVEAISNPSQMKDASGKHIIPQGCERIAASIANVSFATNEIKNLVYNSGYSVTTAFNHYLSLISTPAIMEELSSAKWVKRIFTQSLSLSPFVYSRGEKKYGESVTITGSENKDLSVEIGCLAQNFNGSRWKGYYTSSLEPDIKNPIYLKLSVSLDLTCKAEGGYEPEDYSKFVWNGKMKYYGSDIDWEENDRFSFTPEWHIYSGYNMIGSARNCTSCSPAATYQFVLTY